MGRQVSNFLEGWMEYTDSLPTPYLFRMWTGLCLMSSALSRRGWLAGHSRLPPCTPNLYVMLVGAPGVGKDVSINKAADLIIAASEKAGPVNIARLGGESVSKKGMLDKMANEQSKQTCSYKDTSGTHVFEFHSLTFCIGEFSTAMPEYDPVLVPMLNDLYNNKASYDDTIRGLEVSIKNPHLVLLAGNQPDTLAEVFPEKAFRMGLTSRIIFVFSNEPVIKDIFDESEALWDSSLFDKLASDFVDIAKMGGPFKAEPPVKAAINKFNRERPDEVLVAKFKNYNTRRPLHAQKVAMLCCASESNDRTIRTRHWDQALQLLLEVEAQMGGMLDNIVSSRGFSEVYDTVYQMESPIKQIEISNYLSRIYSPMEVPLIIKQLKSDGVLIPVLNLGGVPQHPAVYKITRP